jgi:hypothetical protein
MSQSRQKPPIGAKRPSKTAPQGASQPASEPSAEPGPQGAPPRPAGPSQGANVPAGSHGEDVTSGPVETTRCDPDLDPKAGLSDQQWLETLPLYAQLRGLPRRIFAEDALTYRRLWAARKTVVARFHEALAAFHEAQTADAALEGTDALRRPARRWGEFQGRTWSWIKLNNPENWGSAWPWSGVVAAARAWSAASGVESARGMAISSDASSGCARHECRSGPAPRAGFSQWPGREWRSCRRVDRFHL